MQAAFYSGVNNIEVKEVPRPVPGPGEVLLRVRACSICGSDLHFYRGELPAFSANSPGHEFSGEILELGKDVEGWSLGQSVVVEPLWTCRNCSHCQAGEPQLCQQRRLMGTVSPGGLAEFVCVPAYGLHLLPSDVDFELGTLVEPLAVAIHGLHRGGLTKDQRVLVLGCGGLGALVILAARALSAGEIVATYRHPQQAEAALMLGASRVVVAGEKLEVEATPPEVIVDTVGRLEATIQQSINVVAPGGTIVLLGMSVEPAKLSPMSLLLKQATIVPSLGYCCRHSDFKAAIAVIKRDPEQARNLISHRFPLGEAAKAFNVAVDKMTGSLKVLVCP